jgi:hypothetical protein
MPFFFGRLTEPVLASGHWYSSPLGGLALFLAWIVPPMVIFWLVFRWDAGVPGAARALVIALAIFAAYMGAAVWLVWFVR